MNDFLRKIEEAKSISILGHMRPDGDCVGSSLGLYNYIVDNYIDKRVQVYLQEFSKDFMFLNGAPLVKHAVDEEQYDLCIVLDSGDLDRVGEFVCYFQRAKTTICVDHHISNLGFGDLCLVNTEACSTSEALCKLIDREKLSQLSAEAFYLGIVHDTGVFKHSNTTKSAMTIAGELIEKGARPHFVIDETFYQKTFIQNQLLGRALLESFLMMDKKIIVSVLRKSIFDFYEATSMDCDGIVDQLRITAGVEVAIFIYESDTSNYKISLRSNGLVNVSSIACSFGGGGHIKAAGFNMTGNIYDIINNITKHIEAQLIGADNID